MQPCCAHQPNYNHQEAPKYGYIPPYYRHTAVVPTVSDLEGLYCIPKNQQKHSANILFGVMSGV